MDNIGLAHQMYSTPCIYFHNFKIKLFIYLFSSKGNLLPLVQDGLQSYTEVVAKQANELEALRAEFELLRSELDLRLELSSELEVQVRTLEKKALVAADEARGAALKLSSVSEEKKSLADQVEESTQSIINIQIEFGLKK